MFVQIALGAIGVGVMLMVGFLVIAKARDGFAPAINSTNSTAIINNAQTQVVAGFGLIAIGIIAVAGFGIGNLFK